MSARQEENLVKIEVNINTSKIDDLTLQKQMLEQQIMEILTEKRIIDKENMELE